MLSVFDRLLSRKSLVDVTLGCEGSTVKAHKVVLSACSPFFEDLFVENPCKHPIVILKDIRYTDLKALVEFMYKGEVNVSQEQLPALLKTAESLKVKGLAEVTGDGKTVSSDTHTPATSVTPRPSSPKRKRQRTRRKSSDESCGSDTDDNSSAPVPQKSSRIEPEVTENSIELPSVANDISRRHSNAAETATSHSSSTTALTPKPADEDFEPTRLLEQTMTTETFTQPPSAADTPTSESASTSEAIMPNIIVPSDTSLDIKPIISFDETGATPAGSIVPASGGASSDSSLVFVNNSLPGPSSYQSSSQQSHGMYIVSNSFRCVG